jgi:CubicO group peptidase (beta-lactamase class C family)
MRVSAGVSTSRILIAAGLAAALFCAAGPARADAAMAARAAALGPQIAAYAAAGMKGFDVPGAVVAVVVDGKVAYSAALGVRAKSDTRPVDAATVFQIGSTTKAFLATTMAIAVDRKALKWDDAIVDRHPRFALKDPWVTREMRLFDIIAQRSGLTPYAHDFMTMLGYGPSALVASLRHAEPITSFRSSFAYTNITHLVAGDIVAAALEGADWNAVAQKEIVGPLGMSSTSFTAEAIAAAPNHAAGHRYDPKGAVEVPFDPVFPYSLGGAGDINSSLDDMTRWLALQMAGGTHEGKRLVSEENLKVTRMARVAMTDVSTYDMGWVTTQTANGRVIWHNGGTVGFGAHLGFAPEHGFGVVVLSNAENNGFPDALAFWIYGKLLGDADLDPMKGALERAKAQAEAAQARFKRPAAPRPAGDLAALAGAYAGPVLGAAKLIAEAGALVLTLEATGAQLRLDPFDGMVFTASLLPTGRFANVVKLTGDMPLGFAQFEAGADGKLGALVFAIEDQTVRLEKE